MAITQQINARDIGERFAAAIRGQEHVRELWMRAVRDFIEVWVLTDAIEPDEAEQLYEASGLLNDWFPDVLFRFHVVNPRLFEPDTTFIGDVIPSGAQRVALRD